MSNYRRFADVYYDTLRELREVREMDKHGHDNDEREPAPELSREWTTRSDRTVRGEMLDEAKQLVTGDRNNSYGPPNQDFQRTADMASAWGFQVDGKPLKSHHVAIFMDIIKTSRLKWTPTKRDSWVDKAGYAACGLECALIEADADTDDESARRMREVR